MKTTQETLKATTALLATGVVDIEPVLPNIRHAIRRRYLLRSPICDAFGVIDRNAAIIGHGESPPEKGEVPQDIHAGCDGPFARSADGGVEGRARELRRMDVTLMEEAVVKVEIGGRITALLISGGSSLRFDNSLFRVGREDQADRARGPGAAQEGDDDLVVDENRRHRFRISTPQAMW